MPSAADNVKKKVAPLSTFFTTNQQNSCGIDAYARNGKIRQGDQGVRYDVQPQYARLPKITVAMRHKAVGGKKMINKAPREYSFRTTPVKTHTQHGPTAAFFHHSLARLVCARTKLERYQPSSFSFIWCPCVTLKLHSFSTQVFLQ